MSNSSLVTYTKLSPNHSGTRNHSIDRITIHCYVGQVTAQQGCAEFLPTAKRASCNYVVGKDGSIGLCVDEKNRSWCSSSSANDNRAITIETASDTKSPYAVTDSAYNALLDLVTDICKRNGKKKLVWFGNKDKTLNYEPANDEMIMTVHMWFANKSCPGQYLLNKHSEIAKIVTERLRGEEEVTQEQFNQMMENYLSQQNAKEPSDWSQEHRDWAENNGIIFGNQDGQKMYKGFCTREQMVTFLHRFAQSSGKE